MIHVSHVGLAKGYKMVKKKKELTIEELINQALVPESEWPYELPDGWVWVRLGSVGKFINGDRGKNYPSKSSFIEKGIPFINAGDIFNNKLSIKKMNYISDDKFNILRSGKVILNDILYCLRGSLGKFALVNIKKGAIASSLVIIRKNELVKTKWLYYYLNSNLATKMITKYENGTAQPNLSVASLKEFLFPLPPLSTQKQIVEKLESMLSKIHEAKKLLKEARETFKNRKSAILHKAFTGELTASYTPPENELTVLELLQGIIDERKEFNKNKKGREKIKGAKTVKEMLVPESEWPYGLPDGWEWVRLGGITEVVSGGTPRTTISEYYNDDIPWITPADLSKYKDIYIEKGRKSISKLGLQKSSAKLLPKNTVLMSSRAPIGYIVIAKNELSTNQGFKSFLPSKLFISHYLYWYLTFSTSLIESFASGTTFKEISGSKTKLIPFPLPPLSTQKQIVEKLESILKKEEQAMELLNIENDLDLLEKSILAKAFRGELTKGNKLSSEETASELLERVLREKNGIDVKVKKGNDGRF